MAHERFERLCSGGAAVAAYASALEFGSSVPVALLAALWFAFSQNVWSHAVRAEAQDLAVACAAFALYAFIRWMRGARDRGLSLPSCFAASEWPRIQTRYGFWARLSSARSSRAGGRRCELPGQRERSSRLR